MGERPEIRDGGEWIDHEDLLVANEEGLRRLRDACDIALREGEYIKGDGVEGEVVEIGLFGPRLRSTTGVYVFTNNNRLWNGAITHHSREPRRRIDVDVTRPDTATIAAVRNAL